MTTPRTRQHAARSTLGALAATVLVLAPTMAAAGTSDATSPDSADRRYLACIQAAPTTPDSHERWVVGCRG